MNLRDAISIVEAEGLPGAFFGKPEHDYADSTVIHRGDNGWIVYVTDERASVVPTGTSHFTNESDALDDFISRLRDLKKYNDLSKKLFGH
ncbi:hypothetical protein [Sinomonas sp. P47F7]|uniref:hypothetical protein n=1 Tax=Sinomonas sp. P47F7 TaxID=3410987 RepID=UPI003BF52726